MRNRSIRDPASVHGFSLLPLLALPEGIWLDMMTMQSPITREEGMRTVFACLAAFFPKHFTAEGAKVPE